MSCNRRDFPFAAKGQAGKVWLGMSISWGLLLNIKIMNYIYLIN